MVREAQEMVELLSTKIKGISKRLRKEKELSFYSAEDFIPTEEYGPEYVEMAIKDAEFVLKTVEEAFNKT